jgi:hypothetical protein
VILVPDTTRWPTSIGTLASIRNGLSQVVATSAPDRDGHAGGDRHPQDAHAAAVADRGAEHPLVIAGAREHLRVRVAELRIWPPIGSSLATARLRNRGE